MIDKSAFSETRFHILQSDVKIQSTIGSSRGTFAGSGRIPLAHERWVVCQLFSISHSGVVSTSRSRRTRPTAGRR